jgi:hypothetical protein
VRNRPEKRVKFPGGADSKRVTAGLSHQYQYNFVGWIAKNILSPGTKVYILAVQVLNEILDQVHAAAQAKMNLV